MGVLSTVKHPTVKNPVPYVGKAAAQDSGLSE
jgi:hypothetical protein